MQTNTMRYIQRLNNRAKQTNTMRYTQRYITNICTL